MQYKVVLDVQAELGEELHPCDATTFNSQSAVATSTTTEL
jgi:hypothetical protein